MGHHPAAALPLAAAAYVVPEAFYGPPMGQRWQTAVAVLVGVTVGVLWQLLHRRDLADRLLVPALLVAAYMGAWMSVEKGRVSVGLLLFAAGLVAALVLTEQVLRRHDRHDKKSARPVDSTVMLQ